MSDNSPAYEAAAGFAPGFTTVVDLGWFVNLGAAAARLPDVMPGPHRMRSDAYRKLPRGCSWAPYLASIVLRSWHDPVVAADR
jgi:hypothetical protein